MHFIYFLGRFHVLAIHLPITLILVVAALEWMTRGGRRPDLQPVLGLAWGATAITAIGTVILGYMHFSEGGFTGADAQAHRALGTTIAIVSLVGWVLRSARRTTFESARPTIVVLLVVLMVVTGHLGGNLTHGKDYLVQYAPNFIRRMAGLPPNLPGVTTLSAADPYVDVVQPVLENGCMGCHNPNKQKGGLDVSTYSSLMRGGSKGPVIVKGNAAASDLIRRISLPPSDDDFMPDGKPPLPAGTISVLKWWVNSGAKTGVKVVDLHPPQDIQTLIESEINPSGARSVLGAASGAVSTEEGASQSASNAAIDQAAQKLAQSDAAEEARPAQRADAKLVQSLVDNGFMARQISDADPDLVVSPAAPGAQFSPEQIQGLSNSSSSQIVDLDLSNASLTDAGIAPIAHLSSLTQLRLAGNDLTDQSVRTLSTLPKLAVLNLYGNRGVTDAAIQTLAQMKSLKRVYLWQTGITPAGLTKLQHLRPDLGVVAGAVGAAAAPPDKPSKP